MIGGMETKTRQPLTLLSLKRNSSDPTTNSHFPQEAAKIPNTPLHKRLEDVATKENLDRNSYHHIKTPDRFHGVNYDNDFMELLQPLQQLPSVNLDNIPALPGGQFFHEEENVVPPAPDFE